MERTTVLSRNGRMVYADGYSLKTCGLCRAEGTDIRWGIETVAEDEAICIYCANSRNRGYQPRAYLGRA